jgi:hypothetical protein
MLRRFNASREIEKVFRPGIRIQAFYRSNGIQHSRAGYSLGATPTNTSDTYSITLCTGPPFEATKCTGGTSFLTNDVLVSSGICSSEDNMPPETFIPHCGPHEYRSGRPFPGLEDGLCGFVAGQKRVRADRGWGYETKSGDLVEITAIAGTCRTTKRFGFSWGTTEDAYGKYAIISHIHPQYADTKSRYTRIASDCITNTTIFSSEDWPQVDVASILRRDLRDTPYRPPPSFRDV